MIELTMKPDGRKVLLNVTDITEVLEPKFRGWPVVVCMRTGSRYDVSESYQTVKTLIFQQVQN
jgi:hypothetical protein